MKRFLILPLLLCVLPACGSSSDSEAAVPGGPLVAASTGWVRVASVKSSEPLGTDHDSFAIAAYDLQVTEGSLRVLYSIDTLIPPAQQTDSPYLSSFFKASTTQGSRAAPVVSAARVATLPRNQNFVFGVRRPVFRVDSDQLETLLFYRSPSEPMAHFDLIDEALSVTTTQAMYFDASHSAKILPNQDILAGDVNDSFIGELDQYHRASNSWTYLNQTAGDGQWLIAYTPFELADGSALAFRVYSEGEQAFLSIADFTPGAMYPEAPYTARFVEEHPEFARTGVSGVRPVYATTTTVGAYASDGQGVTAVLLSKEKTGAYTVSAYSWAVGEQAFHALYTNVVVSKSLGDVLAGARDRVVCQLDGTVSAIVLEDRTYRVAVVGASGEQSLGAVSDNNGGAYGPQLSQLRWFDGAYYAVVGLTLGQRSYQGQYLDVVKLSP
ncbi:MAG: hypothetical protein ABIQ16_21580 [Polyangiaceae bacterium]